MSRELILMSKRKYDDLVHRSSKDNPSGEKVEEKQLFEKKMDDNTNDESAQDDDRDNPQSTTSPSYAENQHGGNLKQKHPYAIMTFESFDNMHSRQNRVIKKQKRRKWLTFQI